jgi:hypothetical protein
MTKAREIHRTHLRTLRVRKFIDLDIQTFRAIEKLLPALKALGADVAELERIVALKTELRDVTTLPAIDAAKTPEELKAAIPAVLTNG